MPSSNQPFCQRSACLALENLSRVELSTLRFRVLRVNSKFQVLFGGDSESSQGRFSRQKLSLKTPEPDQLERLCQRFIVSEEEESSRFLSE